ncbi:hypothetical protein DYB30_006877, partial [Aphanomyces astaci]
ERVASASYFSIKGRPTWIGIAGAAEGSDDVMANVRQNHIHRRVDLDVELPHKREYLSADEVQSTKTLADTAEVTGTEVGYLARRGSVLACMSLVIQSRPYNEQRGFERQRGIPHRWRQRLQSS